MGRFLMCKWWVLKKGPGDLQKIIQKFFEFFGDIKQSIIENQNNQGLKINY